MSIYRGAGGSGDAVNDASSEATLVAQLVVEAQADADAAQASATAAAGSASTASTQATNASNSATAAASSASSASTSATNAAASASTATTKASEASTSATNAASSASSASTSATSASGSASTATTQATNASNSASAASTSATNASNSASAASTSATNAASSATSASGSASTATTQASNASTSATNAASSATSASGSATTATTQAGIATTQATNAASSASAASTSASNAATSATNASNSASTASTQATNASNSASSASTSATNAAASYDAFDDRYLGNKATAPSVDNDGNALLTGALYFDTVSNSMKVWNGSSWLDAYASLSGALIATNNLSDLNNTATARTNLGVAIGTNVQAYDAQLADVAGLTPTDNGVIIGNGTNFVVESGATLKTSLGLTIGTDVQAWDADLDTWATKTAPTGTVVGTSDTQTLTNKTIALGSNTVSGTLAQFNTAVTDADLVSIAGTETLTNKTLTSPTLTTPALGTPASGVVTNLTGTASININGTVGATTANTGAFTTLGATGVATFSAGTVSAPAITTTGDTNTGIYFPAADTIAFTEGGAESMRIDASGQVGIGTSSPASLLSVNGVGTFGSLTSKIKIGLNGDSLSSDGDFYIQTSTANPLILRTNFTERMRIDTSGNVGIGTSSPAQKLDVAGDITFGSANKFTSSANVLNGASGQNGARIRSAVSSVENPTFSNVDDTNTGMFFPAADTLGFTTNSTERGRFDSSGNFQFNSGYGSVAIAYGCRAWVNFNGTGTVAIRASGNVSSITDMSTGTYQVNYSNSLSSDMCPVALCSDDGVSNRAINLQSTNTTYNLTTSCVVTIWIAGGGSADSTGVYVAVFR